jgi:hypothetical protein
MRITLATISLSVLVITLILGLTDLKAHAAFTYYEYRCTEKRAMIDQLFAEKRSCKRDKDCVVYEQSCDPFITCGEAISKKAVNQVKKAVKSFAKTCNNGICAGCMLPGPSPYAVCISGRCELRKNSSYRY